MKQMTSFNIKIDQNYKDKLLTNLAKKEIVHIKELEKEKQKLSKEQDITENIKNLHQNANNLFKKLGLQPSNFKKISIEETEKIEFVIKNLYELVSHLSEEINFYTNRINELERYINKATIELENIELIRKTYSMLDKYGLNRFNLTNFKQLEFKIYTTFSKNLSNLQNLLQFSELPNVYQYEEISEDRIAFYVIYPKEKEEELRERINIIHGEELQILKKYLTYDGINFERIDKEINLINKTLMKYQKEKERIKNDNIDKFAAIFEAINNLEEYNFADNQFKKLPSGRLSLEFFVPSNNKKEVKNELINTFRSQISIETIDIGRRKETIETDDFSETIKLVRQRKSKIKKKKLTKDDIRGKEEESIEDLKSQAPTKIEHNWLIRPFETLTKMYGIPSYSEIDPTVFLFFTFPFLFGTMFGDIGHGIVLIISGIVGAIMLRKKKSAKDLSLIIFYCGWWAILFGFLYGEFFGQHNILGNPIEPISFPVPLFGTITLIHPLSNVMMLFKFTILIGVIHINLGWIIQFVNHLLQSKVYKAFTEPLTKLLFLDGGVIMVFTWGIDLNAWFSDPYPILLPLIPGLFLILFKPLGKVLGISYMSEESFGELIGEGSIETFETVLSIPSNVLSYLRLLALALAHISLMVAIEAITGILGGGGLLTEIIILIGLIFGNIVVILLEGIIVFLNALRLHFYEFFFKFFEGTGIEYNPFIIDNEFSELNFKTEEEKDVISEEIEKEIDTKKAKEFIDNAREYISNKYKV
ncbi:MAG: hypothetical protein GF317_01635 [Candidatus Lokiarchaeota archaeon]|nr:hypothetical protein [Candidatus Lokiarchaeota archaeon]MBD3198646.1 hypothetical protein [Candidatus Lokiarchaeota archaeon]